MIVLLGLSAMLMGPVMVVCGVIRGHFQEKQAALPKIELIPLDEDAPT